MYKAYFHKPYKKPNNSLKYVNKASNHLPCIPRNIPCSIEKRLNTISSSEVEFNEAKADYERALGNAGYSAELEYDAEHSRTTRASKKSRRRIVWYNTPFSKKFATNISRYTKAGFSDFSSKRLFQLPVGR